MNEIKIELSEVNPQEFFGQQNINIEKLRYYFPKLKIVARGSTPKAFGEEAILEDIMLEDEQVFMWLAIKVSADSEK